MMVAAEWRSMSFLQGNMQPSNESPLAAVVAGVAAGGGQGGGAAGEVQRGRIRQLIIEVKMRI